MTKPSDPMWNERRWANPLLQDYESRLARADDAVTILAGKLERAKADRITMIADEARQRFRDETAARQAANKTHCCCCCCKAGH